MMTTAVSRWVCPLVWMPMLLLAPREMCAQIFSRPGDPTVGERYHIEVSGNLWFPSADMVVASEGLNIGGDNIDLTEDLGIEKRTTFREFRLVLRPAQKHKFRLQYVPMTYKASTRLQRSFVFNGLRYTVGVPVETAFDWKMLRIGYEYDFVYLERGYAGITFDARITDARLELSSPPPFGLQFASAQGPVPSIGFTGRFYVVPNVSMSSELSFFRLPETLDERYRASYVDFDIYGTVNFVYWAGVQVGYRRFSVDYKFRQDTGNLKAGGLYLAGVLRY
jgi:hypothetical protein